MRNPLRIPIVLNIFKNNLKCCLEFLGDNSLFYLIKLKQKLPEIEEKWKKYPDSRLGQLLTSMGLVPKNIEDKIWNIEEDDWLIENDYCKVEDIKFWGVNFYKNGKQRKKTKYVLLKDLKTDHIQNIIKFFEGRLHRIPVKYLEYFNKRICNE